MLAVLAVTIRRSWRRPESIEDQVSANIGRVVQVSESDLMARDVAVNLLQMAKRVGPQCKATGHEDLSGRKVSPWTALLLIEGAIEP